MPLIVNGEILDDAEIRAEVNLTRPRYEEMVDGLDPVAKEIQLWDWSKETVIERALLRQEALKDPEPLSPGAVEEAVSAMPPESGDNRQQIEVRLRLDRFLQNFTSKVPPPKYKEIGDYYKKYKEQFLLPETIRIAHIVKNVDDKTDQAAAMAAMQEAEAELKRGVSFEEVADRYSDCAGNGGDLGYFPRGEMVDEFDEAVFALAPGATTGIFRTGFGFHIAKCHDRKPAGYRSLADVRQDIERMLHRERQERALEQYVDELKARAVIRNSIRKG
ncbi:MAG: peptidylprolyl isomerase [Bryobacteraceae bacterium]